MDKSNYTVSILTLGCRVNQYESDYFASSLQQKGVKILPFGEKTDLAIINTCTVTAETDRKSRQMIRRAAASSEKVVVTGCFSQISPDAALLSDKIVYISGNSEKSGLAEKVYDILCGNYSGAVRDVSQPTDISSVSFSIKSPMRCRSYIKIQDGCNNKCSYCIIPSARGPIRSKPQELVLEEANALASGGCREVILTGIETASYGMDFENKLYGHSLADLICEIAKIEGIERIGLGSLDPTVMNDYFVNKIAGVKKVLPHFHLSIQSGSARTLAAMRRKYNPTQALAAIERMRRAIPDVTFSADVIVGFPGESAENYNETVEFCAAAKFLHLHIFPYSKRSGTEAAVMPDQIPENIKKERLRDLEAKSGEIKSRLLSDYVASHRSSPVYVLVEKSTPTESFGHSEHFIEVLIDGIQAEPGSIIPVILDDINNDICVGHAL